MSKTWSQVFVFAVETGLRIFRPKRRWIIRSLIYDQMKGTYPVETDRGELNFHICNRQTLKFANDFKTFEPNTLRWIEQLPSDAVLWDIGANVGMFSLYAALNPNICVVAFEPSAPTYHTLIRNIHLNNLGSRVSAFCMALGDHTRCNILSLSNLEEGGYNHTLRFAAPTLGDEIERNYEQPVLEMSIDNFVQTFSPPLPTHIKLDVDSNENEIIAGAEKLLTGNTVLSVLVEMIGDLDNPRNQKIYKSLKEHQFKPKPKEDDGVTNVEFYRP